LLLPLSPLPTPSAPRRNASALAITMRRPTKNSRPGMQLPIELRVGRKDERELSRIGILSDKEYAYPGHSTSTLKPASRQGINFAPLQTSLTDQWQI
jgi:hypothetical protein